MAGFNNASHGAAGEICFVQSSNSVCPAQSPNLPYLQIVQFTLLIARLRSQSSQSANCADRLHDLASIVT